MKIIEVITTDSKTRYYLSDDAGTPVKPVLSILNSRTMLDMQEIP